jgi:hypothetical protein
MFRSSNVLQDLGDALNHEGHQARPSQREKHNCSQMTRKEPFSCRFYVRDKEIKPPKNHKYQDLKFISPNANLCCRPQTSPDLVVLNSFSAVF